MAWQRYVAIGDSFSEGMCDEYPGRPDQYRGWADRLAAELSARRIVEGLAPLSYANLAVRGRLLRPIVTDQLDAALELRPDLISIVGGGNDILRPDSNLDLLVAQLEYAVVRARRSGADVLLATSTDPVDSPLINLTRGRAAVFYTSIWSIARRHGAYVVDLWGMRCLRDLRMWAPDRIHLTSEGHRRVADAALVALGMEPADPHWDALLDPAAPTSAVQQAAGHLQWAGEHFLPWATRRLRHRSSGDTRQPKQPTLTELHSPPPSH